MKPQTAGTGCVKPTTSQKLHQKFMDASLEELKLELSIRKRNFLF
jgi:hypothetical protein